jgi:hypothetical protein
MNQDDVTRPRPVTALAHFSLFHPDYTVGPGVTPDLLTLREEALAGYTAGGELHPALRTNARLVAGKVA